jgi:hypothetical protein
LPAKTGQKLLIAGRKGFHPTARIAHNALTLESVGVMMRLTAIDGPAFTSHLVPAGVVARVEGRNLSVKFLSGRAARRLPHDGQKADR